MTPPILAPGDVVEILTNQGYLPHSFAPGQQVTIVRQAGVFNRGRWVATGSDPRVPGKRREQILDERDIRLVHSAPQEPAVGPGADPDGESVAVAPTEPAVPAVRVLGHHWKLATDRELELAVGGLRFEKAQRTKELATHG